MYEAGKGTVFFDEIGELSHNLQVKILRALQEREARLLGGVKSYKIEPRIVSATNRDLKKQLKEKKFREDLYYRLAVFPITLCPLRERKEDILLLVKHFIQKYSAGHPGISSEAVKLLKLHNWPGNVRELENTVEYALVMAGRETIFTDHLPMEVKESNQDSIERIIKDLPDLKTLEKRYIDHVLESVGNNRTKAAAILGMSTTTLWRRLA